MPMTKGIRKGKIVAKKATTFKRRQSSLANDQWAVHTTDSNIQNGIAEYMTTKGEGSLIEGEHILWRGRKVPVFFVPFCVVEFLKNNKDKFPNYMSFHRRRRDSSGNDVPYGLWSAWNEGRKGPNAFLKKIFENWGKN